MIRFANCAIVVLLSASIVQGQSDLRRSTKKSSDVVTIAAFADEPARDGKRIIIVTLKIESPYHIYANPVGNELFNVVETQIRAGAQGKAPEMNVEYPPGKKVGDEFGADGSFRIYEGEVKIKVTVFTGKEKASPMEIVAWVSATNLERSLLPSKLRVRIP